MAPSRAVRRAKHCHFVFTALYALVSLAVFLLPFIFINYVSTFQFSAVATVHLVTGALAVALVFYAVLVRLVFAGKRPAKEFDGSEEQAQRFFDRALMALYSGMAVVVACAVILSLVAVGIQLYNLLVILLVKCPQMPPCYNVTVNSTTTAVQQQHQQSQLWDALVLYEDSLHRRLQQLREPGVWTQRGAVSTRSSDCPTDETSWFNVMISTICHNEYAFLVFLVIFLFCIAALDFALLGWFLHVRRNYDY